MMSMDVDDFHRGRGSLVDQLGGDTQWAKYITQQAAKKGYKVGPNDVYLGTLADSPGDPKAFISPDQGKSEVRRRAEEKNMTIDGPGISVESKDLGESPKAKKLNPKHAKNIAKNMRKAGQADGMNDKQLMDHVVKKHGRKD